MDETPEQTPEPQGASGNRWEPTNAENEQPLEPAQQNPYAAPYVPKNVPPFGSPYVPPYGTGTETAAAAPSRPTWLTRTRAGVAGGAAAVLLAGGLGGFAIGQGAGGHEDGLTNQQGVPTGFDHEDDHGFGPGSGQVPGIPGQDDGQQQNDDGTNGSDT
jgi:predicted lipid-binding transport protein (Tim44 family)